MKDVLYSIFLVVLVMALIIAFIWGLIALGDYNRNKDCKQLSEDSGRPTLLRDGFCYVEIAPGLYVREWDLKYNLDLVRPIE